MDSGRCVARSPKKWHTRDWFCHHNNDPAQPALFLHKFVPKKWHDSCPILPRSSTISLYSISKTEVGTEGEEIR